MSFDLFVQSCIILKRMTDVFKRYDDDRDGYITLSFEEFLTGEFSFFFAPWIHLSTFQLMGRGGCYGMAWRKIKQDHFKHQANGIPIRLI